jgi:LysM repeat protein
MNYKTIIFFIFTFTTFQSKAFILRDSIGVENLNGKKIILHKIELKETYYSLGRRYNISPQIIMDFNKGIALQPADVIKIPTQVVFTTTPKSFSSPVKSNQKEIIHYVIAGETLYSISTKYQVVVDDIKNLNKLLSSSLSIGQELKILVANDKLQEKKEDVKAVAKLENATVKAGPSIQTPKKIKYVDSTDSQNTIEIPKNRYGITEMNDKGIAVWIDDNNLDATKSYALHRSAPVGTIIKITNPMTNRSVFAKVVGSYTENTTTKDVIIVLTKASADAIGALDKRFLVNITFGIPNDNQ